MTKPDMTAPTLLLIDVGNSRIKYWFYHATRHPLAPDTVAAAIAHDGIQSLDELRTQLHQQWLNEAQHYGEPLEIRISHVASAALYEHISALCAQLWPNAAIRRIRTRATHSLLQLGYDETQMGSDRYAQILGAQSIGATHPQLVISAGTALTVDGILAGGQHLGGTIGAGLKLTRTALHHYTAQLPLDGGEVTLHHAPQQTRDALASGAMLAAVGAIAQFIQRYCLSRMSDANDTPHLFFCGGDALALMAQCQQAPDLAAIPMRHAPALCLLGLLAM